MQNIQDIIVSSLDELIDEIKTNSTRAGQVATGKTLKSLESVVPSEGGLTYAAQLLARPFFGTLETGSGPARRKGTDKEREAFRRSLEEWCRVRGFPKSGLSDEQLKRAAERLRWYLLRYGSRLYRRGGRKDIFTPAVESFEDRLSNGLLSLFETEVINSFTGGR